MVAPRVPVKRRGDLFQSKFSAFILFWLRLRSIAVHGSKSAGRTSSMRCEGAGKHTVRCGLKRAASGSEISSLNLDHVVSHVVQDHDTTGCQHAEHAAARWNARRGCPKALKLHPRTGPELEQLQASPVQARALRETIESEEQSPWFPLSHLPEGSSTGDFLIPCFSMSSRSQIRMPIQTNGSYRVERKPAFVQRQLLVGSPVIKGIPATAMLA